MDNANANNNLLDESLRAANASTAKWSEFLKSTLEYDPSLNGVPTDITAKYCEFKGVCQTPEELIEKLLDEDQDPSQLANHVRKLDAVYADKVDRIQKSSKHRNEVRLTTMPPSLNRRVRKHFKAIERQLDDDVRPLGGGMSATKPWLLRCRKSETDDWEYYVLKLLGTELADSRAIFQAICETQSTSGSRPDFLIADHSAGLLYFVLEKYTEGVSILRANATTRHLERVGRHLAKLHARPKSIERARFDPISLDVLWAKHTIGNRSGFEKLEDCPLVVSILRERKSEFSKFVNDQLDALRDNLPPSAYWEESQFRRYQIHNDLNFTNILWDRNSLNTSEPMINNVIDWERSVFAPRIEDFRNPLLAFGAEVGRIYSRADLVAVLVGYQCESSNDNKLENEEIRAIPELLRATLLFDLYGLCIKDPNRFYTNRCRQRLVNLKTQLELLERDFPAKNGESRGDLLCREVELRTKDDIDPLSRSTKVLFHHKRSLSMAMLVKALREKNTQGHKLVCAKLADYGLQLQETPRKYLLIRDGDQQFALCRIAAGNDKDVAERRANSVCQVMNLFREHPTTKYLVPEIIAKEQDKWIKVSNAGWHEFFLLEKLVERSEDQLVLPNEHDASSSSWCSEELWRQLGQTCRKLHEVASKFCDEQVPTDLHQLDAHEIKWILNQWVSISGGSDYWREGLLQLASTGRGLAKASAKEFVDCLQNSMQASGAAATVLHGNVSLSSGVIIKKSTGEIMQLIDWSKTRRGPPVEDFKNPILSRPGRTREFDSKLFNAFLTGYGGCEQKKKDVLAVLKCTILWDLYDTCYDVFHRADVHPNEPAEVENLLAMIKALNSEKLSDTQAVAH